MTIANKKINDATDSIKGILYQFYIAVEKCFELAEGERVWIEKDGDISTQNDQIEVKQYEGDLTDSHENIWKTLNNWLDEKFDPKAYKSLILLTTQAIGANSKLVGWNNKSIDEKTQILNEIYSKAKERDDKRKEKNKESKPSDSFKLMTLVLQVEKSEKLKDILGKFYIADSAPMAHDYYEKIKQVYCKGISPKNKDTYLNSLLGYIISPKVVSENSWEVTYNDISLQIEELTSIYCKETKVFPNKYTEESVTDGDKKDVEAHLFVKKIDDIEYHEVKGSAITDFIRTRNTLMDELSGRKALKSTLAAYEEEIMKSFTPMHSQASRNTTKENLIKDSKNFYDDITSRPSPALGNFNNTPSYFRNGTIHSLANEQDKNLIWKLSIEEQQAKP
jgi:hypothetical protein